MTDGSTEHESGVTYEPDFEIAAKFEVADGEIKPRAKRAVPLERLIAVSDAQYPAGMPPGEYEVCGAHARLEPDGLLWNPARNCLVGATAPMAKMMALLKERIGFTDAECLAIGRDNPIRLICG